MIRASPGSLSDLLMNIVSSAGIFVAMAGICLDRLPKQRSALHRLRPPDPTGREGARREKQLSPKWKAGSPVAAVYDRRPSRVGAQPLDRLGALSSSNGLVCARSIVLRFGRTQGAPLRRKIGPDCSFSIFPRYRCFGFRILRFGFPGDVLGSGFAGLGSLSGGAVCIAAATTNWLRPLSQNPTNS
jgi:hypothetical protein